MKTDKELIDELLSILKPQTKGVISMVEIRIIEKVLLLKKRNIVDLRNLRNFFVMYISQTIEEYKRTDIEKMKDMRDIMSAVTAVIDTHILEKGGTV